MAYQTMAMWSILVSRINSFLVFSLKLQDPCIPSEKTSKELFLCLVTLKGSNILIKQI